MNRVFTDGSFLILVHTNTFAKNLPLLFDRVQTLIFDEFSDLG